MSGIFIRSGVCNEACAGQVCHRRVRFLLTPAMNVENRPVVPRRLSSIFYEPHGYQREWENARRGRRKPMSSP